MTPGHRQNAVAAFDAFVDFPHTVTAIDVYKVCAYFIFRIIVITTAIFCLLFFLSPVVKIPEVKTRSKDIITIIIRRH